MTETIRLVDYFYVETPDRPGEAANVLARIKAEGVNLLAFSGFPSGRRSQLDFIPADSEAFKKAARRAGLKLSPRKTGFLVQGGDRVGALADLLGKLAAAKINVTAVDAVCAGEDRYGAIFWVKPRDLKRAAKALGI
jgi:hypothetical protein